MVWPPVCVSHGSLLWFVFAGNLNSLGLLAGNFHFMAGFTHHFLFPGNICNSDQSVFSSTLSTSCMRQILYGSLYVSLSSFPVIKLICWYGRPNSSQIKSFHGLRSSFIVLICVIFSFFQTISNCLFYILKSCDLYFVIWKAK